jgi:hypothetical protein
MLWVLFNAKNNFLVDGIVAKSDFEIGNGLFGVHHQEVGDIQASGLKQIDFATDVEVEQAVESVVRADDAGGYGGVLAFIAKLGPVGIAGGFGLADGGDGQRRAVGGGILGGLLEKNGVSDIVRGEWLDFLATVFADFDEQADALQVDADALVVVVAEGDADSDDATGEGRFAFEFILIAAGSGPWIGADGHAFVRIGVGSVQRFWSGLIGLRRGGEGHAEDGGRHGGSEDEQKCGQVSHKAIINCLHLLAFDSGG